MDKIKELLKAGDLRTDGNSAQVAELVLKDKRHLAELIPCLDDPDSVIRAHAAQAIEAVTRAKPDLMIGEIRHIIMRAESDAYPIVRWHMAMTLGDFAGHLKDALPVVASLLKSLTDTSPLVRSWSVYSLVAVGRKHPDYIPRILTVLCAHENDRSPSVRSRVNRAITLLQFPDQPMPTVWVKKKE
jgi:HEAT repeat protein